MSDAVGMLDAQLTTLSAPEQETPTDRRPIIIKVADVPRRPIEWLWPQRFALGKVGLLPGDPGGGKSHVTLDMAAHVSRGKEWPDGSGMAPEGQVIIMSAEDDVADTIRPRLEAAGGDLDRIHVLQGVELTDEQSGGKIQKAVALADLPTIETALQATPDARLLIVDPVSAFLGHTDSHKNAEVRAMLAPLAELAAKYSIAVVCVTHLNKGSGGKALYRATGSLGFVAAARAAWLVTADEQDRERRLFLPMKNNLGPDSTGLAFRLVPWPADPGYMQVEWEPDPVTVTADEVIDPVHSEKRHEWEYARDWLRDLLADGPMDATDIYAAGEKQKFSEKILRKAADSLRVRKHKVGFGKDSTWTWEL